MFTELVEINSRPEPFQFYTADALWTDKYTSHKMLEYHLNESVDMSSRNKNFIEDSTRWIINRFNIGRNTKIIDFGCGPGLYTTKFAEAQADVTGIDFSESSIQYATANNKLNINYINQNYLEFETDTKFDLITMIMCDFCALSPSQRKVILNKFFRFLKPDGMLLLDVYSLNAFSQRQESQSYELNQLDNFWSADDYYGFVNTFKYESEKVILDKYTIIEQSQTRVIYNWLQYFSQDSIRQEFEENGFKIVEFYSDVAGTALSLDALEMAIVAKKA
ncbi:methyltransferase domain-containing protein [Candidatus Halobeggiatoa sp. HSG11]|nr:methyltransferase domain-containing protein [Candidatus Halobeggiatoa sp. HSG11]